MKQVIPLLLFVFIFQCCNNHPVKFEPAPGSHIIIMGNTFADRMQYYGYFEQMLQENFPAHHLVVRNLGWSADEPYLQPRPLNFGTMAEHLTDQKADIIFMCFGMNESFKGKDSLDAFKNNLDKYCRETAGSKFNGKNAPLIILVSPIAHENVGGYYPNPAGHNKDLELYTSAMAEVAEKNKMGFIDLFHPSSAAMNEAGTAHYTINGIHLNDKGYLAATKWMAEAMGLKYQAPNPTLKKLVVEKDRQFFYRWRAVNGEYIYGRRKKPFGVISYPPEMKKLDEMVTALDSLIWETAANPSDSAKNYDKALGILDESSRPLPREQLSQSEFPASTAQFTMAKGYAINLFASEKDFPVEKPVALNFDAKGRLWVATMPTYPQYFPGFPPRDKIVILEDTDNDGRADKHTVFADSLYLPLGFLFGNGGVYVAEEPNILFLKDTNNDGRADTKEIVLHGFGSEDSHHATHAFTWGQDGAFYFHEGRFLNSQVETPYGPVRGTDGSSYRFEPRTGKLSHYVAYHYNNPWGNVFDKWGVHLIGDASDGSNYYATPMSGNIDYPEQHPEINMFTETRVRPTAGIEIVSSRHFPESAQGNFLVNNTIGFQGIKQHKMSESGSGIHGKEVENLLQSSDPNFRPVDIKFGPDGALYIADWFNPLIGHMQFSLRDPGRDKSHGRIWRITYPSRPLLKPVDLSTQTVPELIENLKAYEDRFRYRSREQLRIQDPAVVIPALDKWVAGLDKNDTAYEHNLLEALWIYQDFDVVKPDLLKTLLNAKNFRARAAATRVLQFWRDRVPGAVSLVSERAKDESPRVRIEAVVALSFFNADSALDAAIGVMNMPMDYYLQYATRETLKYLEAQARKNKNFKENQGTKWLDSLDKIDREAEAKEKAARTENPSSNIFQVETVPSKMMFNKTEIVIPAGQEVTIRFTNPDEMPHNFVIIKKGSLEKVGKAADAMAAKKDGFEKNFIPTLTEVMFATPLVQPGKYFDLEFVAPPAGEYTFICSFPGHWSMMNGKLRAVNK